MENSNEQNRPAHAVDKQAIEVTVTAVDFAEPISPQANPETAVDIVLTLAEASGETHTWRSEISANYGTGNNASKTRAQMTADALATVGFNNPDLSQVEVELLNKRITCSVKWNYHAGKDKWFKNVFLGGGGIRKVDKSKAFNIMRAIGCAAPAPAAFTAAPPPPPSAPKSPFAVQ